MHPLLPGNDTGRVREVTIRRKLSCEIDCGGTPPGQGSNELQEAAVGIVSGGTPQGSLVKGSWHAGGVTEGFTVGTPPKYKPVWKGEGF